MKNILVAVMLAIIGFFVANFAGAAYAASAATKHSVDQQMTLVLQRGVAGMVAGVGVALLWAYAIRQRNLVDSDDQAS